MCETVVDKPYNGMTYTQARREIVRRLSAPEVKMAWNTWTDRPMVIMRLVAEVDGVGQWESAGWAKVNWPDTWDEQKGLMIAKGRALNDMAKHILRCHDAWQTVLSGPVQKEQES